MRPLELARKIDLAALSPTTTRKEAETLAVRARSHAFATLCVPPCLVSSVSRLLDGYPTGVSTVIGFPLGYEMTEVKVTAARRAVDDGAVEVDMVMNQCAFHGGEFAFVQDDISAVVEALPGTPVKVIIECCYLDEGQKVVAAEIVVRAGAEYVKTSTGFGPGGASEEDVRLLSGVLGGRAGIKAAGGIKTLGQALAMIGAGAARVGTSSGMEIVEAMESGDGKGA